jgi:hypothetical protein
MSRRADRDAVRRRLDALAAQPEAPIDPTTLEATETRLRAIYDLHDGHAPAAQDTSESGIHRAGRRRAALGSLAIASVAIAALGAFAALRDDATSTQIELTAARGAYIVLPDGSRIDATAGATIPEGGRLVVDGGGSATIDGVVVGPGETATVVDGELRIGDSTTTTDPASGISRSSVPDTHTDTSSNPPTTGPTATGPPTTAVRTTTSTSVAPTTSLPPTTTVPPREILRLPAGAKVIDGVVRIRWEAYLGENFAGYVVLARLDGERPRPGQDGTIVVLRSRDRNQTVARTPFSAGMSIRVVVMDADRAVVASTRVLRPAIEPRTDTITTTAPTTTVAGVPAPATTAATNTASSTFGTVAAGLVVAARRLRPRTRFSRTGRAVRA